MHFKVQAHTIDTSTFLGNLETFGTVVLSFDDFANAMCNSHVLDERDRVKSLLLQLSFSFNVSEMLVALLILLRFISF